MSRQLCGSTTYTFPPLAADDSQLMQISISTTISFTEPCGSSMHVHSHNAALPTQFPARSSVDLFRMWKSRKIFLTAATAVHKSIIFVAPFRPLSLLAGALSDTDTASQSSLGAKRKQAQNSGSSKPRRTFARLFGLRSEPAAPPGERAKQQQQAPAAGLQPSKVSSSKQQAPSKVLGAVQLHLKFHPLSRTPQAAELRNTGQLPRSSVMCFLRLQMTFD